MKVTTEQHPNCTAIVTVEVDEEQVRRAMVSAAQRVSRIRPIAGFRPGKAPYDRVEKAVGKELLREEVIERLRKEHAELTPVTRPAQLGDIVTMDLNGRAEGDEPFERKGLQIPIETEKPVFPWLEQLVGASPNETRPISYTFPADDADEA